MVLDLIEKDFFTSFWRNWNNEMQIFGVDISSTAKTDNKKRYFDSR